MEDDDERMKMWIKKANERMKLIRKRRKWTNKNKIEGNLRMFEEKNKTKNKGNKNKKKWMKKENIKCMNERRDEKKKKTFVRLNDGLVSKKKSVNERN